MNVECRFRKLKLLITCQDSYEVHKQNLIESKWDKTLKFYGEGITDDSHRAIKSIYFKKCLMRNIPSGLSEIFPDLETLSINQCGLETISKDELSGFKNLKALLLPNNDLTSLSGDLFEENKLIEKISFKNNKLSSIGKDLLDPLTKLSALDFRNNFNVHFWYPIPMNERRILIVKDLFKKHIEKKLKSPGKLTASPLDGLDKEIRKLLSSDDCKDFEIKCNGTDFKVHKLLLAARSPVILKLLQDAPDATTITINDITVESFKVILNFVYDEKFPDEGDNMMEVYAAAAKMRIHQLKEFVASRLLKTIDDTNALKILSLAKKYENQELKLVAFDSIKKLFPDKTLKNELADDPEAVQKLLEAKLEIEKHFVE